MIYHRAFKVGEQLGIQFELNRVESEVRYALKAHCIPEELADLSLRAASLLVSKAVAVQKTEDPMPSPIFWQLFAATPCKGTPDAYPRLIMATTHSDNPLLSSRFNSPLEEAEIFQPPELTDFTHVTYGFGIRAERFLLPNTHKNNLQRRVDTIAFYKEKTASNPLIQRPRDILWALTHSVRQGHHVTQLADISVEPNDQE